MDPQTRVLLEFMKTVDPDTISKLDEQQEILNKVLEDNNFDILDLYKAIAIR